MVHGRRLLPVLLLLLTGGTQAATKQDDLITSLPGLSFTPTFKQYSGYLDGVQGNHLHYWLVESQQSPEWAPLILWLNGGPGCSSLGGFFTELGPFHPTKDGKGLVENVHAWNKAANVLFLESPRDIGFSYRDSKTYGYDNLYNDDKTAMDNALALRDFFNRFPEYQNRPFYITGESYGGVYVPTLTNLVIQMIQNGTLPGVNLVGMAIGNGELSAYQQINSAVDLLYYRGMLGYDQFNSLATCCTDDNGEPLTYCNFAQFITLDDFGNIWPGNYTSATQIDCANKIQSYAQASVWDTTNDVYNSYQDCYSFTPLNQGLKGAAGKRTWKTIMGSRTKRAAVMNSNDASQIFAAGNPFVDQGATFNDYSTDAEQSFPCYMDDATQTYLNLPEVRAALHISPQAAPWVDCNIPVNTQFYHQQNHDTTPVFLSIINSSYPLRVLIYNGDVDMACNFQGDEWFIEALAASQGMTQTQSRQTWNYTRPGGFDGVIGGFFKSWNNARNFSIDLLTVKGAGHFVPTDRPGPALQMLYNYLYSKPYNTPVPYSLTPLPLLPAFQPQPQPTFTRKQQDKIWSLPGLTYNINFNQYSGYLNGVPGNSLHYWFVESQTNPATDPLVLWLNGGPGCSSLMGFLSELGPFHPNKDGKTLFENVYSWNKGANVLFIESPRNVGFSVQNKSVNTDNSYNDEKTAWDNFLALKDFLTVYPEYINRPFYVTGESYGGVYVPTLTSLLIDQIQAGNFPGLNLVGMAVGNGELSGLQQINSAIQLLYFHGLYGKQEWDQLQQCCNASTSSPTWFEYCDFSQWITLDQFGNAQPRDPNSVCGPLVVSMGQTRVWNSINDVYNIYQDCYEQTTVVFGSRSLRSHKIAYKKKMMMNAIQGFNDQGAQVSAYSTDSQGGFQCYSSDAAATYLNSQDVRTALHISPIAGNWSSCNNDINELYYIQQHNDTSAVFDHMIKSGYPLRIMIYNGDVDMACNFIGDQWFIEATAKRNNMQTTKNFAEWRYMNQIAGYAKQFSFPTGTIDLVTVKGAGHLVPSDRPGPALQMFTNFLRQQPLTNPIPYNTHLTGLKQGYQVDQQVAQANNPAINVPANGPTMNESAQKKSQTKFRKGRLGLKRRSIARARRQLKQEETIVRAKRSANPAPPPPPLSTKADDLIKNLTGLTFTPTFNQYSGYLEASQGNYLHYWLVESQGNPATDPLILWLNGGPGCSSLGGFLEELGPFHVNPDGQTLFENVFSWNKAGNVIFMEAPRDVGFSYRSNEYSPDSMYNDTYTANDNVAALISFFKKFPEYQNRPFFITGESYGGVYVPTLTRALIKTIQGGASYINLVGVGIGNGEMSEIQQINSAVSLLYFRGEHGKSDYDSLSQCCNSSNTHQTYCDFVSYITLDTSGNAWPKYNDGSIAAQCGQMVVTQGFDDVWGTDNDVYNTFQDCYTDYNGGSVQSKRRRSKRDVQPLSTSPFVDQAKKINYGSTDSNNGFTCYNDDATQNYLNLPQVRRDLHIPDGVPFWQDCNDNMNENYIQMHNDTTAVFQDILNSGYPLRFLIYNGDIDMACQFLGDEWFIENLASINGMTATQRSPWNYTQGSSYLPRIGGYFKTFGYSGVNNTKVSFDLLTVKGGGHFVPTDRPGPALQMIYNFVNQQDYSTNLTLNIARQPLLSQYQPPLVTVPRRKADMIFDLPGLTYQPQFGQHSGYLTTSTPGNYLHYWFVESQNDPSSDPVVLWLNGGPGCSSVGGLLAENGPFHVNPDGTTLFENVYSWNKGASVIYLESPRGVGFSYQDKNANPDQTWDDTKTAADAADAVADFFNTYPQFRQNDFFVTGESYGGVYVPTLTRNLIQRIQNGTLQLNLKGMAIGNGMISTIKDIRSLPDFLYYHGIYGKQEYDALKACCPSTLPNQTTLYCNYEIFVNVDDQGNVVAKSFPGDAFKQNCANLVEQMSYDRIQSTGYDIYNLYQDCYTYGDDVFVLGADKKQSRMQDIPGTNSRYNAKKQFLRQMGKLAVSPAAAANPSQFDPISTDNFGGFQCFMTDSATRYLAQSHVRDALHIPDFVQPWTFCSDLNYTIQYNDTTPVFQDILNSGYNLRVLIYNGDTDTACSMFEAEWMIEDFAKSNNFVVTNPRAPWTYGNTIGGYVKKFQSRNRTMTVQLATVKGAGHMVPTDRPGPALQMIYNYLIKQDNLNTTAPFSRVRQPLLPQFTQTGVNSQSGTGTAAPPTPKVTQSPPVTGTQGQNTQPSGTQPTGAPQSSTAVPQNSTAPAPVTTTKSASLATVALSFLLTFLFL